MKSKKEIEKEYNYPLDYDWSTEEIIVVIAFFQSVEQAYEKGVARDQLMTSYRQFKEVVPSKSEEKQLFAAFEKESRYCSYQTVQKARKSPEEEKIKMTLNTKA